MGQVDSGMTNAGQQASDVLGNTTTGQMSAAEAQAFQLAEELGLDIADDVTVDLGDFSTDDELMRQIFSDGGVATAGQQASDVLGNNPTVQPDVGVFIHR